jgi:hypothetical protein
METGADPTGPPVEISRLMTLLSIGRFRLLTLLIWPAKCMTNPVRVLVAVLLLLTVVWRLEPTS